VRDVVQQSELLKAAENRKKGPFLAKLRGYFKAYDFHFQRFRNAKIKLLEIGVQDGGSLWIWKRCYNQGDLLYD